MVDNGPLSIGRDGDRKGSCMIAKEAGLTSEQSNRSCWVVSDGAAGNERQALALATALGLSPRIIRLRLSHPWDWFAPRLDLGAMHAMRAEDGQAIAAPWPDIAIGCGRKAALLTRCLRACSEGRSFTVQILDPRVSPDLFDVVVAPHHDQLAGSNVLGTIGGLHAIDDARLAEGRARFTQLGDLPAPRTGVLIGATHPAQALDEEYFAALLRMLGRRHVEEGGSFLVSTSRRTPVDLAQRLRRDFSAWPGLVWTGAEQGENPYMGILGWADRFVVTADSVNMVSEACATGKPVHVFAPRRIPGKLGVFHDALMRAGHLSSIDFEPGTAAAPLRELDELARRVQVFWQSHRLRTG